MGSTMGMCFMWVYYTNNFTSPWSPISFFSAWHDLHIILENIHIFKHYRGKNAVLLCRAHVTLIIITQLQKCQHMMQFHRKSSESTWWWIKIWSEMTWLIANFYAATMKKRANSLWTKLHLSCKGNEAGVLMMTTVLMWCRTNSKKYLCVVWIHVN